MAARSLEGGRKPTKGSWKLAIRSGIATGGIGMTMCTQQQKHSSLEAPDDCELFSPSHVVPYATSAARSAPTTKSSVNAARKETFPKADITRMVTRLIARSPAQVLFRLLRNTCPIAPDDLSFVRGFWKNGLRDRAHELVFRVREQRIEPLLESQRGHGLAAHAFAAKRTGEVSWIDLETIWQRQDLALDAAIEIPRILLNMLREVWPANGSDKQGIAGQQKPGLDAACRVRYNEANTLRRVTWGMKHPGRRIAEDNLLAIPQGKEGERNRGRLMKRIDSSRSGGQRAAARNMIGVNMRVDYMCDAHSLRSAELDIGLDVLRLRIDDSGVSLAAAAKHVRCTSRFEVIEWPEDHDCEYTS